MADLVADTLVKLRKAGRAERRKAASWYFPSRLEALGVATPDMWRIARELRRKLENADARLVVAVASALVATCTVDGRAVAYALLSFRRDAQALINVRLLERLGRANDNWGSVDHFACTVAGPAWRQGRISDVAVARWARSKDRWWRRTSLVCTVPLNARSRGGDGDAARTLRICKMHVADHDPFVVKALSWALRELSRRDPVPVREFLKTHATVLHPRVIREVRPKLATGLKNPRRR